MSNLRLAYDADDYIKTKIRVLYTSDDGLRVYDFEAEKEADIEFDGIVGEYSRISGDEYTIIVHRESLFYI